VKCSGGVSGVEEQEQKHRQQAGSYGLVVCQPHYRGRKKRPC